MAVRIITRRVEEHMMDHPPARLGGDEVVLYTKIDHRHEHTGATEHYWGATLMPPASGLLICRCESEACYCLSGCDEDWHSVTDTWHATLEEAKQQAEYEYKGVSQTWMRPE